ncbi:MAG: ABC transporter permease subunit [Rhodobacter sp.]|nr:ABC transporter permease subunit [Rhodobacter sp.]
MPEALSPVRIIARKDVSDALRDRFIPLITGFLVLAALVSLIAGAIALATDVTTYENARATLLALGKSAEAIAAPEFYPLKLLRGAIEQTEIIGAAVAILVGHRAAASERGRQTLALILTRPVRRWQFLAGKVAAGILLLAVGLAAVLAVCAVALHLGSGIGLGLADLGRIAIVWVAALAYTSCFFLSAFILTLSMRRPPHALLAAFSIWLLLVLIAPQIGDTLDPDNQVAGGVFKQLHIAKPDQIEILGGFAGYEAVRTGIEAASITKHFERFGFAVLGIKDTYTGQPLGPILHEKAGDALFILLCLLGLGALALVLPLDPDRLTKE